MKKLATWAETNRERIGDVFNAISSILWLISLFVTRTFAGAGVMLLYVFFNATQNTTVYQLAQLVHTWNFWQITMIIAVIYSAVLMVVHGSIGGHRVEARYISAAYASGPTKCSEGQQCPPGNLKALLASLPQQPQRQDATNNQLRDLAAFAVRLGMYDAADSIRSQIGNR